MSEILRHEDPRRFDEQRAEVLELSLDMKTEHIVNRRILIKRMQHRQQSGKHRRIHARLGIYAPGNDVIIWEPDLENPEYKLPPVVDTDRIEGRLFLPTDRARIFIGYEYTVRILKGGGERPMILSVAHIRDINVWSRERSGEDPLITLRRVRDRTMGR